MDGARAVRSGSWRSRSIHWWRKLPSFFLLNSYTTGLSASVMEYILGVVIRDRIGGQVSSDEIGLPVKSTGYVLPCGSTAIWQR